MSISRRRALERGQQAIERPKGQMEITLRHGKTGLSLLYDGKVIAKTTASAVGKRLAPYVAYALGASLPPVGGSTTAVVSSGVMFRVLSLCTLDLRTPEASVLLDYLVREAESLRSFRSMAAE